MLEKLTKIKLITTSGKEIALIVSDGLVERIYANTKESKNEVIGFNIYSTLRHLLKNDDIDSIYRMKQDEWVKMNMDKVLELANHPMSQCI